PPTLAPGRSPLFPYPTLFRSVEAAHRHTGDHERHERERRIVAVEEEVAEAGDRGRRGPGVAQHGAEQERQLRPEEGDPRGDGGQDRKSTRLNSSHVKSSYAVF